jgi:flagellar FliL protein
MVTQRAEPAHGAEEKPRARQPQAPEPEAPAAPKLNSAWKAWLPLGLAVVVMPLLAFALTSFVLVPKMQKSLMAAGLAAPADAGKESHSEAAGSEKGGGHDGQKQNVTLNKLLVNVAGTMGSRYLLTSLTIMGKGADFPARVTQNEPQLRDMACGLLSIKTIVDLEKPGARNVIRGELLSGFNSILGNGAVQEIYFTEFSIQ